MSDAANMQMKNQAYLRSFRFNIEGKLGTESLEDDSS